MGAITHPDVVDNYLQNETTAGRVVGPFLAKSLPEVHISWFGVIPKNHHPDKWRLIVDLSYPSGHSVNDGIPKDLCSLNMTGFAKTVPNGTRIELPFIAWHES